MKEAIRHQDLEAATTADLPWCNMAGSTVLVTGAAGFLASAVVRVLLHLNATRHLNMTILAFARSEAKVRRLFQAELDAGDLTFLQGDVCEPPPWDGPLEYIFHAASLASPNHYGTNPVGVILPNVQGTRLLLELARERHNRGFLFFSSSEVYGEVTRLPIAETDYGWLDPTAPRSCYAESKRLGETLCVAYHKQYGVPARIVRPFHTYGPGMDLHDVRVFSEFVANVVARRDIQLKSSGEATRSFCYLSDAVRGFFTVLLRGEPGVAYNVSDDGGEISIKALAQLVASLYPELCLKVVLADQNLPGDGHPKGYLQSTITRQHADVSQLRALGWIPQISIPNGFKRTIESYL